MTNVFRDPSRTRIQDAKRRVARVLCSPPVGLAIGRLGRGVVRTRGLSIDTRAPGVDDHARAQLFWRIYEAAELRLLAKHLVPAPSIVELGTSLGVLSSSAARHHGGSVRLLCVEANPDLLPVAESNIHRNAPHARLELIHGAIDYQTTGGDVTFTRGEHHTASSLRGSDSGSDRPSAFTAPRVRLSDLLTAHEVGEYVLLCDIEGAEAGLLLEDPASLDRCRQMIIEFHHTDFHGRAFSPDDLRRVAVGLGFDLVESYGSVSVLVRK